MKTTLRSMMAKTRRRRRTNRRATAAPKSFDKGLIWLPEPRLLFGSDQSVEDPRDGLTLFGPLDKGRPYGVRAGAIGTATGIALFKRWLQWVQGPVESIKASIARPPFPGFEAAFRIPWDPNPALALEIPVDELASHMYLDDRHQRIFETVKVYTDRIENALQSEETKPDVWFIVIPPDVWKYGRPKSTVAPAMRQEALKHFTSVRQAKEHLTAPSLFEERNEAAQAYVATERLLTGDLDTPIDTVAQDELGQLVRSFDDLARQLRIEWTQARAEAKRAVEAESRVREGEARNQVVLESALDAVVTINAAGALTWWNGQAQKMYGLTHEALGKPAADLLLAESHRDAFRRFLETPEGPAHNQRIEVMAMRNGQEFPIELSITMAQGGNGTDCTFSAFIRDITRRKKMELELRQAQKLESVGRLAAGVAHEINTPVQFVNDNMHFLKTGLEDVCRVIEQYQALRHSVAGDLPSRELAEAIVHIEQDADLEYLVENMPAAIGRSIEGLGRVAAIVRSMKEFAHPDQTQMSTVDLNRAIESTLVIARNEYKYVADVETDFGTIPHVLCHGGDVNQAVLNIIVNASHAIEDVVAGTDRRGHITFRTTRHDEDWVEIAISDTGGGIPDAVGDRIFDPFFTTKEVGKGTGQGLAIARAVVIEKHGGTLTFETEQGVGTTFFMRLPIDGRGGIKNAA